jgi:hypothetical protein
MTANNTKNRISGSDGVAGPLAAVRGLYRSFRDRLASVAGSRVPEEHPGDGVARCLVATRVCQFTL